MNGTDESLPSGVTGEFIPALAWNEMVEWVRARSQETSGPFWYRGPLDPIVVFAALSQTVNAAIAVGIFGADVTNRPPLLAAKQLMTVNQLCGGMLQLVADDSTTFREVREQLEHVAAVDGVEPPRLVGTHS